MRTLTAGALCALIVAAPVLAQTNPGAEETGNVYRNDLPETHEGLGLPPLGEAAAGEALPEELAEISRLSVAGQQLGVLATTKNTSGVVRDLGDSMALVHAAVNARIDQLGETARDAGLPQNLDDAAQATITRLGDLNGPSFGQGLAAWIIETYPGLLDTWTDLEDSPRFGDFAQEVRPWLRRQLQVAKAVSAAGGAAGQMEISALPSLVPGQTGPEQGAGKGEGQLGERQHTQETEQPAIQTGANYAHEQVETDPQSETRMTGESTVPAGEPGIRNSAAVFMALANLRTELSQLRGRSGLSADEVRVVAAQETMAAADLAAVRSSVEERREDVQAMRREIESNDAIGGALKGAAVSAEDVIALDVTDEGAVLYTLRQGG
jgi:hypothetical protein